MKGQVEDMNLSKIESSQATMYLLPCPKESKELEGVFILHYDTPIVISTECQLAVNHYSKILKDDIIFNTGFSLPILRGEAMENGIYIAMDSSLGEQEYVLDIEANMINIKGGDQAAILYGIQSLRQIISQKGAVLPCISIHDHPGIKNRGFYHDVTRGRIPTLAYLKSLADKLSYYKINQLQLYVEHSYLFKNLSVVWRDDTPLTAEEIMELDEYCSRLNIELVPSLSSFGHLHKLLTTKTYAHLCELPNSNKEPFSFRDRMHHHTIDTSQKESYELITSMIGEFMPLFRSKHFNICADETFDLGISRSKELADEIGTDRLYIDFLKKLCNFVISKDKIPMFWGDIISKFPEVINELPKESICLNWGYAWDQREDETKALARARVTQYICPGVSGWNQLINLIEYSYKNIRLMCDYAYKYNAIGVLNTDWGDYGHINHPEFSTAGLIFGASFSWNKEDIPFEEMLKRISIIEYRDKSKKLMTIVSNISKQSLFSWERVVIYRELHHKDDEKTMADTGVALEYTDLSKVLETNEYINDLNKQLYKTINSMDSSMRKVVKPYLVSSTGIALWNKIGATINHTVHKRVNKAAVAPNQLAMELEQWFHQYKEIWRTISKESELFRLQELINWYADYLRDIK